MGGLFGGGGGGTAYSPVPAPVYIPVPTPVPAAPSEEQKRLQEILIKNQGDLAQREKDLAAERDILKKNNTAKLNAIRSRSGQQSNLLAWLEGGQPGEKLGG